MKTELIGRNVKVNVINECLDGRRGVITSIGNAVLPIHVTLEGESWETDFKLEELEMECD